MYKQIEAKCTNFFKNAMKHSEYRYECNQTFTKNQSLALNKP